MRHYPAPPRPRNGSTRQWRTMRALILERDHHLCQWCGAKATHVDHIKPMHSGGTDHPSNLRAMCAHCNLAREH